VLCSRARKASERPAAKRDVGGLVAGMPCICKHGILAARRPARVPPPSLAPLMPQLPQRTVHTTAERESPYALTIFFCAHTLVP